jgi:hypothetical protein
VLNYRNRAVLLYEKETGRLDVLYAGDRFDLSSLGSIPVAEYSHRKEIERAWRLRETERHLVERFRAKGFPEGEAMLKAGDEIEKMGLYPKTPKILARTVRAPGADHPLFRISRKEFLYGLFPDIEKALKAEGSEVRFWGNYITHRDFDTSRKLNAYLAGGNSMFYVETGGKTFLLTISR